MKNIFLFGECMIELMARSGETPVSLPKAMYQSYAGDVFNTAVYLKRLFADVNVSLVTAAGKDDFSDDMVKYFEQEQLNTDFVYRANDRTLGLYAIELDEHGERSFVYWRNNSAARTVMNFINEEAVNALSAGDVFFFSGISLGVVQPEDRDKFWRLVCQLKAAGVKIAFDLNYRPKLWANKEEAIAQFTLAFEAADILLPGVDDFAAIFDINEVESIITFFERYDYQELIIKNGEKNVYCLSGAGREIVDVTPVQTVVDTTSAGDSFNGGYLGGRMAGHSLVESVELANQVAGFVIQHPGAIVDKSTFSSRFS